MVVKTKTKDSTGRVYDKIFFNDEHNVISCVGKKNRKLRVKSNFSLRSGKSCFGEEVVLQFVVKRVMEEYDSKSGFDEHLEAYFPINEESLALFSGLVDLIKEKLEGKENG